MGAPKIRKLIQKHTLLQVVVHVKGCLDRCSQLIQEGGGRDHLPVRRRYEMGHANEELKRSGSESSSVLGAHRKCVAWVEVWQVEEKVETMLARVLVVDCLNDPLL
jgi:hypothetical protein